MQQVAPLTDCEFEQFQRFIHEAAGISLSDAKKPLVPTAPGSFAPTTGDTARRPSASIRRTRVT